MSACLVCVCVFELFVNRKRLLWFVRQTRRHIANVYVASTLERNRGDRGKGSLWECEGSMGEGADWAQFYVASWALNNRINCPTWRNFSSIRKSCSNFLRLMYICRLRSEERWQLMRHNWIIPPLNISPECESCEHPLPIATHCEVRVRLGGFRRRL